MPVAERRSGASIVFDGRDPRPIIRSLDRSGLGIRSQVHLRRSSTPPQNEMPRLEATFSLARIANQPQAANGKPSITVRYRNKKSDARITYMYGTPNTVGEFLLMGYSWSSAIIAYAQETPNMGRRITQVGDSRNQSLTTPSTYASTTPNVVPTSTHEQ